jgi:hypothetical protein
MLVVEKAPEVSVQVAGSFFEAINKRIKDRINKRGNWKGKYDFNITAPKDTIFAPEDWPEGENGYYFVNYCLGYLLGDTFKVQQWLSVILGLEGSNIKLYFYFDEKSFMMKPKQAKQAFEALSKNPRLVNAGFLYDRNLDTGIYIPFSFLPDKVADEYPDFDESLEPLDRALDSLLSVHDVFDDFVKNELSKNIQPASPESADDI